MNTKISRKQFNYMSSLITSAKDSLNIEQKAKLAMLLLSDKEKDNYNQILLYTGVCEDKNGRLRKIPKQ